MNEWTRREGSIKLIPNGLAVSCRRTCPAFIHISRPVGLRKTIVALSRGSFNDYAKHFEFYHDGHNVAAAARFYQLLIYRLVAPAFEKGIIIVSGHFMNPIFITCVYK
jgi:hypothetical protein